MLTGRSDRFRFRACFAAIVVGAAVLRLVYVLGAKPGEPVFGDQVYYSAQAVTIANGRWFAEPFLTNGFAADHAPLTALALAPVSWSDAHAVMAQRLLMTGYGIIVVVGIGILARWLFGRGVALVATAIAAIYANLWMNDALLMSETLAAAGVVAILVCVYVYDLRRTTGAAVAIGVVLGLAGLARAELLLLGPMVVLPLVISRRGALAWPVRVRHLAVATVLCVAVLAPWVVRNLVRFEDTTIISAQDGLALIGANCDETYTGDGKGFWNLECGTRVDLPAELDQSQRSTVLRREAVDYIGEHVDEVPGVVAARLGRGLSVWKTEQMIAFNTGEGREPWASRIGLWQYWLLTPLAFWGWWRWPSRQPRWPAMVTAGLSVLVITVFYGLPRFRIPAEIVIVLGAAVTVEAIGRWIVGRARAGHEPA